MLLAILLVKSKVDPITNSNTMATSPSQTQPLANMPSATSSNDLELSSSSAVDSINSNSGAGYVYVISNPSLPDNLVKIGFTERDPSERIKELDQAGLPTDYVEHYRVFTSNARQLEKRLHEHFQAKRYRKDKEFFRVLPHEVYDVLKEWGVSSLEI